MVATTIKLPADQVAQAVFGALGIALPENLRGFKLEVDSWDGVPTLTMTTDVQIGEKHTRVQTQKFRLEPIEGGVVPRIPMEIPRFDQSTMDGCLRFVNTPSNPECVESAIWKIYQRPAEVVTCNVKYFPRDHADNICNCSAKINDHLCLCGCGAKCGEARFHCEICGERVSALSAAPQHVCKTAHIRERNPTLLNGINATAAGMVQIPDGFMRLDGYVALPSKHKLKFNDSGDCPDCYVGLSGQIEKCEKHREGMA